MTMPAGNLVTSRGLLLQRCSSLLGETTARAESVQIAVCKLTVNGKKAVALCDSGSQIPVVSSRLLDVGDDDKMATMNLQGVIGEAVTVLLMSVNVKLSGDEQCEQVMEQLQLLCAVVDLNSSSHDVICQLMWLASYVISLLWK